MSPPDTFLKEINAQKVSVPLLGKVMHLYASLPRDEWRDFDRKLERVVEFVEGEDGSEGSPLLAMAIALRLMALDAMLVDPELRAWLISGRSWDGITYIHGDLLRVAAEETLLEGPAGEPIFNRVSFLAHLMQLSSTRGQA
jgi:hypothetical protein